MGRRLVALLSAALLMLCVNRTALAQLIFRDGFEIPCSVLDADGDRLTGCQEVLVQTDPAVADTDGDGLSDGDEIFGTLAGLDLPAMGVNPRKKDILMDYDWYIDATEAGVDSCAAVGTHTHKPTQDMLDIVTVMFAAAPVANPNGTSGIRVIHDIGQGGVFTGGTQVTDVDGDGIIQGDVRGSQFDAHYANDFAPNRKGYFHYVLLPHRYVAYDGNTNYSGHADLPDGIMRDEMIVSLYCRYSARNVGHTIAHELGHNLGLHHGGNTDCNYKPNYNSIMNYRHQFPGVDSDCDGNVSNGPANYLLGIRNVLDENNLNEATGGCGGVPINWNGINGIEASVQADINSQDTLQATWCGGTHTVLSDHNDWANIVLDMTPAGNEQGNIPLPAPKSRPCTAHRLLRRRIRDASSLGFPFPPYSEHDLVGVGNARRTASVQLHLPSVCSDPCRQRTTANEYCGLCATHADASGGDLLTAHD